MVEFSPSEIANNFQRKVTRKTTDEVYERALRIKAATLEASGKISRKDRESAVEAINQGSEKLKVDIDALKAAALIEVFGFLGTPVATAAFAASYGLWENAFLSTGISIVAGALTTAPIRFANYVIESRKRENQSNPERKKEIELLIKFGWIPPGPLIPATRIIQREKAMLGLLLPNAVYDLKERFSKTFR